MGYSRIGICIGNDLDRNSAHLCRAAAHYLNAGIPQSKRIPPLFYSWGTAEEREEGAVQVREWIQSSRPNVIIGHNNQLVAWAEELGFKVPEEMGVVHMSTDDDVSSWAGICSHRREMGEAAVDCVIGQMNSRRMGLPEVAINMVVRGAWHEGATLRSLRPSKV